MIRRTLALVRWALTGGGYETDALARVVLAKTRRAQASGRLSEFVDPITLAGTLLAITSAAACTTRRPLRVLDFGGAYGTAYLIAREVTDVTLRWAVVETPSFGAHDPNEAGMAMFDSITTAQRWLGGVDLVYTSGALQYTDVPEAMLAQLVALQPRAIVLLRTAFALTRTTVEIQESRLSENGPGPLPDGTQDRAIQYPRTCVTEESVRASLAPDYRLMVHLPSEHGDVYLWRHR